MDELSKLLLDLRGKAIQSYSRKITTIILWTDLNTLRVTVGGVGTPMSIETFLSIYDIDTLQMVGAK